MISLKPRGLGLFLIVCGGVRKGVQPVRGSRCNLR
jgi:hypothetical protein